MSNTLLIKNGTVVSPADRVNGVRDVLIADGKIEKMGRALRVRADKVIDAVGLSVAPGFIDLCAHFREPGFESKETIATGSEAAAAGGFTAVALMPTTSPVVDNETVVKFILDRAKSVSVRCLPVGASTKNLEGKTLAEIALMKEAGIVAVTDEGRTVLDSGVMRNVFRYAKMEALTVLCYSDDEGLSAGGVINEGPMSALLGLKGSPRSAEEIIAARNLILAAETGAALHLAHVSTKGTADILRRAKRQNARATAATAPPYFTLTEGVLEQFNPNHKVNPPLREQSDVAAIIKALADGTLDAIASDHSPHTVDDKDVEFDQAPDGCASIESAVAVGLTELVAKRKITLSRLVELMSVNPARILNVEGGSLKIGAAADLTLIDLKRTWTVESKKFLSLGRNTPFEGRKLTGKAVMTIVGGRITYKDKSIHDR